MPRRIGRPGLIGTMARTAVIAGTATATSRAVSNKMSGGQSQEYAAQQQPAPQQAAPQQPVAAAPAAPANPESNEITDDTIAQVEKLSSLHQAGALTDEEFAAAKARLLGL